jgi:hypothetical protein
LKTGGTAGGPKTFGARSCVAATSAPLGAKNIVRAKRVPHKVESINKKTGTQRDFCEAKIPKNFLKNDHFPLKNSSELSPFCFPQLFFKLYLAEIFLILYVKIENITQSFGKKILANFFCAYGFWIFLILYKNKYFHGST